MERGQSSTIYATNNQLLPLMAAQIQMFSQEFRWKNKPVINEAFSIVRRWNKRANREWINERLPFEIFRDCLLFFSGNAIHRGVPFF